MKWFRFYSEVIDDPKIHKLSNYEYRIFTYLLCYACEVDAVNGRLTSDLSAINHRLRTRYDHFFRALKRLEELDIISVNCDGEMTLTNWDKRQYKSDKSLERVRKFREKKSKNKEQCNSLVTAPDSDSDTDKEKNKHIQEIFSYWKEKMKHPNAKLDSNRRGRIEARLREGRGLDEFKLAIDGCANSTYHQGDNDRRKVYDDIELICRDAKHFEMFKEINNTKIKSSW